MAIATKLFLSPDINIETATKAVLNVLRHKISSGEWDKMMDLKKLFQ